MGRPKGHRLSQETKDRISAGARRGWARRREWVDVSNSILAAANSGDRDRASAILEDYLGERHAEFQASVHGLSSLSQADRQDILADMAAYADELRAETLRLQRERRTVTDADIETFRRSLLRDVQVLVTLSNALNRRKQEVSFYDAATTPYVAPTDVRHVPVTTTHTHDHAAYGHPDHTDGLHSHTHTHDGDATHDHDHSHTVGRPDGEMRPGRVGQTGEGVYGRLMGGNLGPAERNRLRKQQIAEQEARRGNPA